MIFLILKEDVEKPFLKLWDRYFRAKRKLKKKSRSVTLSGSVDKIKEKLESLKHLTWFNKFAKPRSARSSIVDMSDEDKEKISDVKTNLNFTQSDEESIESHYYLKGALIQI